MIIRNQSPKGKYVHVKINGYSYKKWIAGYTSLNMKEVDRISQINQNAHAEAIIKEEANLGIEVDNVLDLYKYTISVSTTGTGGTSSLSATTVNVNQGLSSTFSVYTESNEHVTGFTINNTNFLGSISNTSASTINYTVNNIHADQNVQVWFGVNGG